MKFKFVFAKLLEHRRKLEDIARKNYLEAQAKVDTSMRMLDGFYEQVEHARKQAGELSQTDGPHAASLGQIDQFINGQKIRIERQRAEVRELMGEAERMQELLIEAAKETKTLDKLRERRHEEYKVKRKKMELKEADELVVTRFRRASE